MALGALAANPNSDLKIICCGMNYFHAHKFRSRAVVEFSAPIEVPPELVELYRSGERREATRQLLEIIYNGLLAVTITTPDYDSLMLIQAVRRLYKPKGKKLPLPTIVELNRRLAQGYKQYHDDPRIVNLRKNILKYNGQLWMLGVRDHQVEYANLSTPVVIFTLLYRLAKIAVLALGTLPGLILFAPIFIAAKVISIRKSREALAASTVKLQGRDVIATWKLLVALGMTPLVYTFDVCVLAYWNYRNHVQGFVPTWVPLWLLVIGGYTFFIMITFAALRIGETGMDILKSLRPLVLCLNPTQSNTFVKLRKTREHLSMEVTEVINTLGPSMFEDFELTRLVADPFRTGALQEPESPVDSPTHSRTNSYTLQKASTNGEDGDLDAPTAAHGQLPRNESFHDLSNLGIFASRPASRSRSRAASRNGTFASLNAMTTKENLEEVSKRIRGAMHERGIERSRRRSEGSWEFAEHGEASGKQSPVPGDSKKDA